MSYNYICPDNLWRIFVSVWCIHKVAAADDGDADAVGDVGRSNSCYIQK